jgi:hypothetical protein
MTHVLHQGTTRTERIAVSEPSCAWRRPTSVNRKRWAEVAVAAAALAVLIVVSVVWIGGRTAGSPASQREAFGFDAAYADPDPMVLVVRYGDSSSCPSTGVHHTVVQQPDRVVVTLTRTPMPADRACTSDYGAKLVRISLTAPLGSRAVIDGSRNKPVPISTGTPPFG